jgi:hypothetical protein
MGLIGLCFSQDEVEKLHRGERVVKVYERPVGKEFPDPEHIDATGQEFGSPHFTVRVVSVTAKQRGKGKKRVHMDWSYTFEEETR